MENLSNGILLFHSQTHSRPAISDTDVVVIGVAVFDDLNMDHLWMTFGKGKDLRWIPIHDIVRSLGPRSKAVPFFHAFTGSRYL
jgi:hypothetical protein